jgi:membrane protease YdiL (CAAX protease family)
MSDHPEKISIRNRIGGSLQNNKLVLGITLIIFVAINIFELIPQIFRVPISLLLVWLFSWLVGAKWSDLGFRRPDHWGKTIAVGVGVAIVSQALVALVILPLFKLVGLGSPDYSGFENIKGNLGMALMFLGISWTTAGFGEEIINRGFLMEQFAKLFGGKFAWLLSLITVSAIFGLGHAYQGPIGMLLVTYSGLVYGLLYILGKRNLWYTIFAHGTADTIAFLALYTGLMEKLL